MSNYWLSIDPANSTGWALWEDAELIDSGTLEGRSRDRHDKRLIAISQWLRCAINEYNIQLIIFESAFCGRSIKTALIQGEKAGMIKAVCALYDVEYKQVSPSEWAATVGIGGRRENKKAESIAMVELEYGSEHAQTDDQADAVLIGMAYLMERDAV